MSEKIKIKIILGSIREGRFGERPARWLYEQIKDWKDVEVELVDLKDYPMPLFDAPITPSMMNMKYPNAVVQKWSAKVNDGDAFIIVAPEYNHGYSGSLKNAIDWLSPEWGRKPVGFVSYGSASGSRAIEQLREVVIELNMVPIKKAIHIGWEFIMKAGSEKNISNDELFGPLRKSMGPDRVAGLMEDLLWMANALKNARTK